MLQTRIKTALVLVTLLLLAVAGGRWTLSLLATVAVVLALYELYLMSSGLTYGQCAKLSCSVLLPVLGYLSTGYQGLFAGLLISCLLQVAFAISIVEGSIHQTDYKQLASSLGLGLLYPGIFGLSLILLALNYPVKYSVLLIVAVATADTAAYFGGRSFGGPKLAERVSPNKTVSGALVGITTSTIAVYLFHYFFIWEDLNSVSILLQLQTVLLGVVLSVASIFGDLMASLCKRAFQVKDSGTLLPGHGGVLDRIDGVLAAAPVLLLILS